MCCVSAAAPPFGRPGIPPSPVSSVCVWEKEERESVQVQQCVCVCVCVCVQRKERDSVIDSKWRTFYVDQRNWSIWFFDVRCSKERSYVIMLIDWYLFER